MKRLFLLSVLLISAFSAVSFAQSENTNKPVAIRVGSGGSMMLDETRPRRVAEPVAAVKSSVVINAASYEKTAFDLINQKREEKGLKPLEWSNQLLGVARLHSKNMSDLDFFSHKGLDGKYVSDRADEFKIGKWDSIGENIAFNRGFSDPVSKAVTLWFASPTHFANLMNPEWKEAAVGIAIKEDGSYYFTQVFLKR